MQQQPPPQHAGWAGFSPGPMSVSMSPVGFGTVTGEGEDSSPLFFQCTPGCQQQQSPPPCQDSASRFNSWVQSTSPFRQASARKTPPTASMKSVALQDDVAGGRDTGEASENTPPPAAAGAAGHSASAGSGEPGFQAWLRATRSTSWTPRRSPGAGTPPPAPAPSPAVAPMSILRDLPPSATTPHQHHQQQHQQAAAAGGHDEPEDDSGGDFGEASTTVGLDALHAAAARTRAANLGAAGSRQQAPPSSTPPRVPAPSPAARTGGAAAGGGATDQQQLLQAAADSLATPISHLSLGRRPGSFSSPAAAAAGSPAEQLIGLMLSPEGGQGSSRQRTGGHHRHSQAQQQQHTLSRLAGAVAGAPASPNLQVISLMMESAGAGGADDEPAAAAPGATASGQELAATGADDDGAAAADSDGSSSYASSVSDDEMDVAELQALVGGAADLGADTPLSAILGMMRTPAGAGLATALGLPGARAPAGGDELNPRVLFGDD